MNKGIDNIHLSQVEAKIFVSKLSNWGKELVFCINAIDNYKL